MAHKPIESYGVIGDLRSAALVGLDGAIDWCCLPNFDSPSAFAALLDEQRGGSFRLAATEAATCRQMYLPDTNVLLTSFRSADHVGEVCDFMPIQAAGAGQRGRREIIRIARAVLGEVRFRLECRPALDFGRCPHRTRCVPQGALFCRTGDGTGTALGLLSTIPLTPLSGDDESGGVAAEFVLRPGESRAFILRYDEDAGAAADLLAEPADAEAALTRTVDFWRRWIGRSRYSGRWRERVNRSALVLKLLTFEPTGAIVAAPTCSLPEELGGTQNWDYRYTWIRDAAFTVDAFLALGYVEAASRFIGWLSARAAEPAGPCGPLQVLYRIDGRHALPEAELMHLKGYQGSRPVRVGNAAAQQVQLDIYGEIIRALDLYDQFGLHIAHDTWLEIQRMVHWVVKNWQSPDKGIWELRGEPRHFVYSKMQCWVALDRALRLATRRSFPAEREQLAQERDRIYQQIMEKGYDPQRGFVQSFCAPSLDASNLRMPLVSFIGPTDPRMLATIDGSLRELARDSLVQRYQPGSGLGASEGTFCICTFWLVEALARARRLDEALFIFEKMLTCANHLGLYAEKLGPTGEALGNFPQAYTHLGLISAALCLDQALTARQRSQI